MRLQMLDELNRARRNREAVVLMSRLDGGMQHLYRRDDGEGGTAMPAEHRALAGQALQSGESRVVAAGDGDWFLHVFAPPPRLVVVGAVHISQALVPLAEACGYEVTVIDPRRAFATADRFPGARLSTEWPDRALADLKPDARTAIVTLTHDPKLDEPALAIALRSPAFYIGALGSARTQAARRERLLALGFAATEQERIHGPIGIGIGARTPAEIALSIMAQLTMVRYGRGS